MSKKSGKKPTCQQLVPVDMPLPGYAQLIYKRCSNPATVSVRGHLVCQKCAEELE